MEPPRLTQIDKFKNYRVLEPPRLPNPPRRTRNPPLLKQIDTRLDVRVALEPPLTRPALRFSEPLLSPQGGAGGELLDE